MFNSDLSNKNAFCGNTLQSIFTCLCTFAGRVLGSVFRSTTRRAKHRAHCTPSLPRKFHLKHYSRCEFRSQVIRYRENPRRALVSRQGGIPIFSLKCVSLSIFHLQDGSCFGNFISQVAWRRTFLARDRVWKRSTTKPTSLPNALNARRDASKPDADEGRTRREKEKNVSEREGSAREFAGRLKCGSAVSRPHTRNSTRLRRTSPPSPSVLFRGSGVVQAERRGRERRACARWRIGRREHRYLLLLSSSVISDAHAKELILQNGYSMN